MGNRFASGKHAIAQCDRCDQRFKLKILKTEIIKTKNYNLLVCPSAGIQISRSCSWVCFQWMTRRL
jgi:hypothetical protein